MPSTFLGFSAGGGGGSSFFFGITYGPTSFPGPPASGGGASEGFWVLAPGGGWDGCGCGFCCWVLAGGCCCCGSACAAPVPIRATPDNQSSGKDKPKRERIRLFLRANWKKNMDTPRNTLC